MVEALEDSLVEFLRYHNWANERLFVACEGLEEEQLALDSAGAFGTIYETLAHIVRGDGSYIELLTATGPQPPFDWNAGPGVGQMRAFAAQQGEILLEAARQVGPETVVREVGEDGTVWHYRAMTVYIQIVNHGVEHRTNITTVLNQEGLGPPGVDGWGYLEEAWERLGVKRA